MFAVAFVLVLFVALFRLWFGGLVGVLFLLFAVVYFCVCVCCCFCELF